MVLTSDRGQTPAVLETLKNEKKEKNTYSISSYTNLLDSLKHVTSQMVYNHTELA